MYLCHLSVSFSVQSGVATWSINQTWPVWTAELTECCPSAPPALARPVNPSWREERRKYWFGCVFIKNVRVGYWSNLANNSQKNAWLALFLTLTFFSYTTLQLKNFWWFCPGCLFKINYSIAVLFDWQQITQLLQKGTYEGAPKYH